MASCAALDGAVRVAGDDRRPFRVRVITGAHRPVHLVRGDDEDRFRFQFPRELQRDSMTSTLLRTNGTGSVMRPVDVGFGGHRDQVVHMPDAAGHLRAERGGQVMGDDLDAVRLVRAGGEDLADPVGLPLVPERVRGDYVPVGIYEEVLKAMVAD